MLTGNYGPFNWLALLLCFVLLDDRHISGLTELIPDTEISEEGTVPPAWSSWTEVGMIGLLMVLNCLVLINWLNISTPAWVQSASSYIQSTRTVNPYGLFGRMTTRRPEIVLQGSRDGENWKSYEFRYKPGDPRRAPGIAIWSLPRIDWRMWFAALRAPRRPRWMMRFVRGIMKGNDSITGLLANNPFGERPPRYFRAILFRYKFSDWEEGWENGIWWSRTRKGLYIPPLTLEDGRLRRVR